jgi:hypothetical protein
VVSIGVVNKLLDLLECFNLLEVFGVNISLVNLLKSLINGCLLILRVVINGVIFILLYELNCIGHQSNFSDALV